MDLREDNSNLINNLSNKEVILFNKDKSNLIELDDLSRDDFEPGNSDDFPQNLPEIGDLKRVYVEVTGSQDYKWHLLQIRVDKKENGRVVKSWSAYNPNDPANGCWFIKDPNRKYTLEVR